MRRVKINLGIQVTRTGGKWTPFEYRMFYCRQNDTGTQDWANESVELLGVLGGVPGDKKMRVGETRRYWATCILSAWQDYWGESDQDIEFTKIRRAK